MLPAAAQAFARRGVATGDALKQLPPEISEATAERYVEYSLAGGGGIPSLGFELFAASMAHHPADARQDVQRVVQPILFEDHGSRGNLPSDELTGHGLELRLRQALE